MSWKLGKIGLGSISTVVCGRWMLTASSSGGRETVFDNVGSLLDLRLNKPNSSVDDDSKIKSCSCSTLLGLVGVCGFVEQNGGSSLKWVIVGISKSDDCSSSIPTSVSLDELECCAWCSMNARPCCACENKISENDDSKLWSDCCCWLINSSCCCCCWSNK